MRIWRSAIVTLAVATLASASCKDTFDDSCPPGKVPSGTKCVVPAAGAGGTGGGASGAAGSVGGKGATAGTGGAGTGGAAGSAGASGAGASGAGAGGAGSGGAGAAGAGGAGSAGQGGAGAAGSAGAGAAPGLLGWPCVDDLDCKEGSCLKGANVCTRACGAPSECPASSNWTCGATSKGKECTCTPLGPEACDGIDSDCDGVVDDGATCSGGYACFGGKCVCKAGNMCGNTCPDLTGDPKNCGGCGKACGAGFECADSMCVCKKTQCGDACVDLASTNLHCGECNKACSPTERCEAKKCEVDREWVRWTIKDAPALVVGAETAVDTNTGLEWQLVAPTEAKTWDEAKAYCAGLTLAGKGGWKLPTVAEWVSVLDMGAKPYYPAVFAGGASLEYWTGTPTGSDGSAALLVLKGIPYPEWVTKPKAVRCVR